MEQTKILPTPQHPGRLDYLDSTKGICVILIVIAHHLLGADLLLRYLYSFTLTPFFLVSGFLSGRKRDWEQPFRTFAINNCKRLLYPFFTFSVINLVWNVLYYKVVFPNAVPDFYSLKTMFLYSVTTYGYNALWCLPCMFWGALLFAALRRQKHHRLIWAVCSVLLIVFYMLFNDALSGHGLISYIYSYLFRCTTTMLFIYAGSFLYELMQCMKRRQEQLVLVCCLILCAVCLMLYHFLPEHFPIISLASHSLGNPIFYYLYALTPSIAIILLCKNHLKSDRILTYFGRNSLIVMALHMDIFVRIGWYIVGKLGIDLGETVNSVIVIALELAMAPIFIYMINRYFPFIMKYPKKSTN